MEEPRDLLGKGNGMDDDSWIDDHLMSDYDERNGDVESDVDDDDV